MSFWPIFLGILLYFGMLFNIGTLYEDRTHCCGALIVPITFAAIGLLIFLGAIEIGLKYVCVLMMTNFIVFLIAGLIDGVIEEVSCFGGTNLCCGIIYTILYFACAIVLFGIFSGKAQNIIPIETPVIEEARYILCEDDSENDDSILIHVIRNDGENYYKFYYSSVNEDGEVEAIPYEISEDRVRIILHSNGMEEADEDYLLVTSTKYYKEDRNKEPPVVIGDSIVTEYKLYLRESTFENMTVVTEAERNGK